LYPRRRAGHQRQTAGDYGLRRFSAAFLPLVFVLANNVSYVRAPRSKLQNQKSGVWPIANVAACGGLAFGEALSR